MGGSDSDGDRDVRALLRGLAHAPEASPSEVVDVEFTAGGIHPRERGPRLAPGTRLADRFVIGERIGMGGTGEVYRARDERLGRAVAIKRIAVEVTEERRRRFEIESRAIAALEHPNVIGVYDVGIHDGAPYLVLELVEGETLRQVLRRGALAPARALALARQIAEGLAAIHERGLVHRDLKPENVMVLDGGPAKILDFGLAKLVTTEGESVESLTGDGKVLGTIGYMSPEQLRGEELDHRSDLFALGAILIEMVTGRAAFTGRTSPETVTAILRDDPRALDGGALPRRFAQVCRHCVEKKPERRFQSARDLVVALEALDPDEPVAKRRVRAPALVLAGVAIAGTAVGVAFLIHRGARPAQAAAGPPLELARLTFERGVVTGARFAPDGATVIYSAAWRGAPPELYTTRAGVFDSRPLGVGSAELLAMSANGELAVKTGIDAHSVWGFWSTGKLALVPLAGGAPRERAAAVTEAEFLPDGKLVAVRLVDGRFLLEWPLGTVVARTNGWFGQPRIAPAGDVLALVDHPFPEDDGGEIALVSPDGSRRTLTRHYLSIQGLAWHGDEVWFTAATTGAARELRAVNRSGNERLIETIPGTLRVLDTAPDGRLLLAREDTRSRMFAGELTAPARPERELSWLDGSAAKGLSADGSKLLFSESWDGGGAQYSHYVRTTDGATPAVRLGSGDAWSISDDGEWAFTSNKETMSIVPTGPGEGQASAAPAPYGSGRFWHDRAVVVDRDSYLHLVPRSLASIGPPIGERLGDPYYFALSRISARVAFVALDGSLRLGSLEGGPATPIRGVPAGFVPLEFTKDDGSLILVSRHRLPADIIELDLATGESHVLRTIQPVDRAGLVGGGTIDIHLSADGRVYAYNLLQTLSTLYEARPR